MWVRLASWNSSCWWRLLFGLSSTFVGLGLLLAELVDVISPFKTVYPGGWSCNVQPFLSTRNVKDMPLLSLKLFLGSFVASLALPLSGLFSFHWPMRTGIKHVTPWFWCIHQYIDNISRFSFSVISWWQVFMTLHFALQVETPVLLIYLLV